MRGFKETYQLCRIFCRTKWRGICLSAPPWLVTPNVRNPQESPAKYFSSWWRPSSGSCRLCSGRSQVCLESRYLDPRLGRRRDWRSWVRELAESSPAWQTPGQPICTTDFSVPPASSRLSSVILLWSVSLNTHTHSHNWHQLLVIFSTWHRWYSGVQSLSYLQLYRLDEQNQNLVTKNLPSVISYKRISSLYVTLKIWYWRIYIY